MLSWGGEGRASRVADTNEAPETPQGHLRREVQATVFEILWRLANESAIATDLAMEHATATDMVTDVANDEAVLDRAYGRYSEIIEREKRVKLHKQNEPAQWDTDWRPTRTQVALLSVGGSTIILAFIALFVIPLQISIAIDILPAVIAFWLIRFGMSETTNRWLTWLHRYLWLLLRTRWQNIESTQNIRDMLIPDVYEWINGKRPRSFTTTLTIRNASGLDAPEEETPVVRTAATNRFIHEINRSDPGAIGIAGRRGVGKSTLIERAARNEFIQAQRGLLTVLASAPVRYGARDYVLHLHAAACRAVLDQLPGRRRESLSVEQTWAKVSDREWRKYFIARAIRYVARLVIWLCVAAACAYLAHGLRYRTVHAVWTAVLGTYRNFAQDPTRLIAESQTSLIPDIVMGLIVASTAISLIVRTIKLAGRCLWFTAHRFIHRMQNGPPERPSPTEKALVVLARQDLRRIRYLQTHTTGWSGTFSPSSLFGISPSRSLQRAEQPLTHPEVVDGLRNFLNCVVEALYPTRIGGIMVAIDELDKISNPADAEQFINEIKGIFGIPHCVFVVSVSEDALASFEGRGIPVRDSFDSAFATMIYIEPFTLDESRTWLARRAIGIPEPFVCLCHCLAGGIPRDLRRTAVALHDLLIEGDGEHQPTLDDVVLRLIGDDINTRLRAFSTTASQIDSDDTSEFLTVVNTAPPMQSAADMLTLCTTLLSRTRSDGNQLDLLRWQAACYLYFCATIREIFTADLPAADLEAACGTEGHLGDTIRILATARQHMALDPRLSWHLLTEFRSRWHLAETTGEQSYGAAKSEA